MNNTKIICTNTNVYYSEEPSSIDLATSQINYISQLKERCIGKVIILKSFHETILQG